MLFRFCSRDAMDLRRDYPAPGSSYFSAAAVVSAISTVENRPAAWLLTHSSARLHCGASIGLAHRQLNMVPRRLCSSLRLPSTNRLRFAFVYCVPVLISCI